MHHEPEPPEVSHAQSQTLEEFFYPAPEGAEYHPRWNRPPPFWPPHEHIVYPAEPPPWLLQDRGKDGVGGLLSADDSMEAPKQLCPGTV